MQRACRRQPAQYVLKGSTQLRQLWWKHTSAPWPQAGTQGLLVSLHHVGAHMMRRELRDT